MCVYMCVYSNGKICKSRCVYMYIYGNIADLRLYVQIGTSKISSTPLCYMIAMIVLWSG